MRVRLLDYTVFLVMQKSFVVLAIYINDNDLHSSNSGAFEEEY